jgi:tRNA threonylcarbamoyladenosine biosynthesis protein TsaE
VRSGPDLVHADASRLGSLAEVDDLDLDASLDDSVTVVEWGKGRVEALSENRIEISIDRDAEPRRVLYRQIIAPGENS